MEHLNNQAVQRQLFTQYRCAAQSGLQLPHYSEAGFRVFSQCDEDGILLYIYSLIGFANRLLLDIAFAGPYGANTTNLLCNWGFHGLLLEGSAAGVEASRQFFAAHPDTALLPPSIECAWVTAENINQILWQHKLSGEIDLFSLDVDGVDYWLWKSLTVVQPRVVVVEACAYMGAELSVTVPYRPDFNRFDLHEWFCGASIQAFVKLAREKGYRLVAANRLGFNLFFVRNDLAPALLPEISAQDCFRFEPEPLRLRRQERLKSVSGFGWVEV